MSDVFKWTFATIFHYALITSPMLMAQDTPPVENASAQQPEVRVPDDLKDGASPFGGAGVRDSSSNADLPASNVSAPTVTVDEEQLKIFHLQHSDANQTAAVIEQLFAGAIVKVAVDTRTNSLIVRSNEPLLQQIEAILLRLDEQPGQRAPIVSSTTGTNANSAITIMPEPTSTSNPPGVPIAEYRRRLNELEMPLLQLAEKVRSTEASFGKEHPESLKQRADLRESIQKTFAARQEIQRAELAEFTRRLRRMQQSIDSRDLIAAKIVDRRLEELLNPETSWGAPSTESEEFRICVGDPVVPSISGESVSETMPEPVTVSSAEEDFFPRPAWSPKSDAEKAISRLVLVFSEDKARRAVPAVLIQHGQETIALTTSPATIVPENIEHAIDRTFLEFFDRENVPTTYANFSTPDLVLHVAKEQLTSFQLKNPVTLRPGDVLSAILMHGQADLEVTPNAARVTAVEQKATWQLPSHELNREFFGLIQIDQRLPEGTPLFKDGQLAGVTLLGTRFMKDDVSGSYVVPASRIVEVLKQLKIE